MTRNDKLAEAVFGDDPKIQQPEWKQIQEEEQKRRETLLNKQKTERLAREAAAAEEPKSKTPSRSRRKA